LLDGTHHSIGGKEYYEYLALDTKIGLIHRHLRKGRECTYGYRILLEELEDVGYIPEVIVSDGGKGIASTLRYFELNVHQRCHIHILRDLRHGLRIPKRGLRKNIRKYYLYKYCKLLLKSNNEKEKQLRWQHLQRVVLKMWIPLGDAEKNVIKSFVRSLKPAFTFLEYQDYYHIPKTTNELEGYISQLNTRLKTMRGLKSPANAELLLNAIHYFRKIQ